MVRTLVGLDGKFQHSSKLFFDRMKHLAAPFELECTSVSQYTAKFLEINTNIKCGVIRCSPFDKVSKLIAPLLAIDSDHHPRVLQNWQAPYINRRCNICTHTLVKSCLRSVGPLGCLACRTIPVISYIRYIS